MSTHYEHTIAYIKSFHDESNEFKHHVPIESVRTRRSNDFKHVDNYILDGLRGVGGSICVTHLSVVQELIESFFNLA